jgi:ribosomal protein S18 acetylase RimI-like enzyme
VPVIRRATADDWAAVRDVRLRALADTPTAFGSSLARERAFTDDEWRQRLSGPNATFLADDGAAGTATGIRGEGGRRELVGMWVDPAARGTGAADALIASVRAWAVGDGGLVLTLGVTEGNDRARRVYVRNGFTPTGTSEPSHSHAGTCFEHLRTPLWSIRRLTEEEWPTARALRLRSLLADPRAFGSTHDANAALPDENWQRRVATEAWFVAGDAGVAVGVPLGDDRVELTGMWLDPSARGTGLADALIAEVIAWAEASGGRHLELVVALENDAARRLYERHGFARTGRGAPVSPLGVTAEVLARPIS